MFYRISNCLYVFGGKKITSCEYYSLIDNKVYKLPDLIYDRANASFFVSNNKIFGFFVSVIQRIHTQRPLSIWIILKKINGTN
jgi:hypothetical protein